MAVYFAYFLLSGYIFLMSQHVADCITCYSCDACDHNKNSWSTTLDILDIGAACFKYDYKDKPIVFTNRGVRSPCLPGSDGGDGKTYCCSTNYCNGSVSPSISLGFRFVLIGGVCLFKTVLIN